MRPYLSLNYSHSKFARLSLVKLNIHIFRVPVVKITLSLIIWYTARFKNRKFCHFLIAKNVTYWDKPENNFPESKIWFNFLTTLWLQQRMSLSAIISIDFKEVSHRDYDFLPKNYNVNATWIIKICSKFAVENYILLGKNYWTYCFF